MTKKSDGYEFRELELSEFDRFAVTHPLNNFVQSMAVASAQQARGLKTVALGLLFDSTVVAAGIFIIRPWRFGLSWCESPKGYLANYTDAHTVDLFTSHLRQYLASHRVAYLKISPYIADQERDATGKPVTGGADNRSITKGLQSAGYIHGGYKVDEAGISSMFVKELTEGISSKEVFDGMSYRTRKAINKAKNNGVTIRECASDELELFYETVAEASRTKGFINRPLEYYRSIIDATTRDQAKFLIAELDTGRFFADVKRRIDANKSIVDAISDTPTSKQLRQAKVAQQLLESDRSTYESLRHLEGKGVIRLAAIYAFCYGDEVVTVIGGTVQEYAYFNGVSLIYWHMLEYAVDHGFRRFNFYGTYGIDSPTSPGYSVYTFKLGFGGHIVNLLGDFYLPIIRPVALPYIWLTTRR